MATITTSSPFVTGNKLVAGQWNVKYNLLYNELNGGLDNANIATTAGILESKLQFSASGHDHSNSNGLNIAASFNTSGITTGCMLQFNGSTWATLGTGANGSKLKTGAKVLDLFEYASSSTAQENYVSSSAYTDDLTPTMTSDTAPAGIVTSSSYYTPTVATPFHAFDKNTSTNWVNNDGDEYPATYIQYKLDTQQVVTKYTITNSNDANRAYDPLGWIFQGSNDGLVWATLDTRGSVTFSGPSQALSYTFNNSTLYYYYRVGQINHNVTPFHAQIAEINFYGDKLQCFSESTIKSQGTYSLKVHAGMTASLNATLTRTLSSTVDLTGYNNLQFDLYTSRTGSNITLSIKDSGGTTTSITPNITAANQWVTIPWDISSVSTADKDAINKIIVTIANADADNIFYIDNFISTDKLLRWE